MSGFARLSAGDSGDLNWPTCSLSPEAGGVDEECTSSLRLSSVWGHLRPGGPHLGRTADPDAIVSVLRDQDESANNRDSKEIYPKIPGILKLRASAHSCLGSLSPSVCSFLFSYSSSFSISPLW